MKIVFRFLAAYCVSALRSLGNNHVLGVKLYFVGNNFCSLAMFLAKLFLRDNAVIPGKWLTFYQTFILENMALGMLPSAHSKSHSSSTSIFQPSSTHTCLITGYLVSVTFTTTPRRLGEIRWRRRCFFLKIFEERSILFLTTKIIQILSYSFPLWAFWPAWVVRPRSSEFWFDFFHNCLKLGQYYNGLTLKLFCFLRSATRNRRRETYTCPSWWHTPSPFLKMAGLSSSIHKFTIHLKGIIKAWTNIRACTKCPNELILPQNLLAEGFIFTFVIR